MILLPPIPESDQAQIEAARAVALVADARNFCATPPAQLNDADLSAFVSIAQFLPAYLDQCEAEAKRRLQAGATLSGWELAPGQKRTAIHNTADAYRRLAPILAHETLLDCCSMAIGKITQAIQDAEGVTEAQAKDLLAEYLRRGGNLVISNCEPQLKRKAQTAQVHEINNPSQE